MSTRAVIVDGTVKRSAVAGSQLLKRGQQRRLHSKRVATLIMNGEELYTRATAVLLKRITDGLLRPMKKGKRKTRNRPGTDRKK
jgi:hypothetical protein